MLKLIKRSGRKIAASVIAAGLALANASYFQTVDFSNVYVSAATGEYLTWKQSDPRWADIRLGGSWETIRQSGCAVTSVAMLLVKSGNFDETTINPGTLCEFLTNNGGLDRSACIYWGKVSQLCPSFTFEGTGLLYGTTAEEKAAEYKSYLDQGYYLVADVKYSGHWVAIDRVENGVVYSIDPAAGTSNVLFDQYNFRGCTCVKLFKSADQPIRSLEPTVDSSVTYETGSYVTTDSLRIRENASTSSDTLDILENNTKISVEDVSGCWGKVSVNGVTGWVCLNYAEKTADETENTVVEEAVAETKEFLTGEYVTNDVINFRSAPTTSADSFGLIQNGVVLQVSQISENWGKTSYNEKECWICLDYADRTGDLVTEETVNEEVSVEEAVAEETAAEEAVVEEAVAEETETEEAVLEEAVTEEESEETDDSVMTDEELTETETVSEDEQQTVEEVLEEQNEATEEAAATDSEPETAETTEDAVEELQIDEEAVPYITIDALNFRAQRGVSAANPPICVISPYEIVEVKEIADNWGKIEYKGQTGWICLSYAEVIGEKESSPEETAADTVTADVNVETEETSEVSDEEIVLDTQTVSDSEQTSETIENVQNSEEVTETIKGDINHDGIVNILDIVEIAKMILQISDKNLCADITGDGNVSVSDFVALKRILIGE